MSSRAKSKAKAKFNPKKDEEAKYSKSDKYRSKSNDSSWYTRNSQLALDAGRLAFTWPTGAPVDWAYPSPATIFDTDGTKSRFPGVLELPFYPTFGFANSADDPLNVSSANVYHWVRHENSGHTNYDHTDLMLYLMAMDSVYCWYQHLVRIYGAVNLFAQRNRNLPFAIFKALNVDYNDILSNLADFRAYINVTALKIGSMVVPNTMPLYYRHMWMSSGIYSDSPSIKSQFYLFRPAAVGIYNEKSSSAGGFLQSYIIPTSTPDTFATLKTVMDSLIAPIIASEDCNIMSGDIKKAYGDNLFQIAQISDGYTVVPDYSEEVLRQIQNATILQTVSYNNGKIIDQDIDKNILVSSYKLRIASAAAGGKRILTGSSEDPSPEEVLVSSRLMVTGEVQNVVVSDTPQWEFVNPSVGTEVIANAHIHTIDSNYADYGVKYAIAHIASGYLGNIIPKTLTILSLLSFFNYHPMVNIARVNKDSGTNLTVAEEIYPIFDVDNYAVLDDHDVAKLHNTALLSLLDVPQLGRVM